MGILIDKALTHFDVLYKSLILCEHGHLLLSLHIIDKTYQQRSKLLQTQNFEKEGIAHCSFNMVRTNMVFSLT